LELLYKLWTETRSRETVKVYGYPSNGGDTITFTEGKISGFDKGHYKIDANLDSGNSGGGAFDKDNNFI
jgi:hypothetical protein